MPGIRTRYMILLAQSIDQKWMLHEDGPSITDRYMNALADDLDWEDEVEAKKDIKK